MAGDEKPRQEKDAMTDEPKLRMRRIDEGPRRDIIGDLLKKRQPTPLAELVTDMEINHIQAMVAARRAVAAEREVKRHSKRINVLLGELRDQKVRFAMVSAKFVCLLKMTPEEWKEIDARSKARPA
jgi:hypothetical protein